MNVEEITSVEVFKKEYFPEGFETEDAGFTVKSVEIYICIHVMLLLVATILHMAMFSS